MFLLGVEGCEGFLEGGHGVIILYVDLILVLSADKVFSIDFLWIKEYNGGYMSNILSESNLLSVYPENTDGLTEYELGGGVTGDEESGDFLGGSEGADDLGENPAGSARNSQNSQDGWIDITDTMAYYKELATVYGSEQMLAYVLQAKYGDEMAKDAVVRGNIGFVLRAARGYKGRGVEFDDLVQKGMEGILRAIEAFDFNEGVQFSTYVTYWIKGKMGREIKDMRQTIRIPRDLQDHDNKIRKVQLNFKRENGRYASEEEVAAMLGIGIALVKRVYYVRRLAKTVSLNMTVGKDEDSEFGDFIPDEQQEIEIEAAETGALNFDSMLLFDGLTERERLVLTMRAEGKTLEECGKVFSVSRERIRQNEADARKKIKDKIRLILGMEGGSLESAEDPIDLMFRAEAVLKKRAG